MKPSLVLSFFQEIERLNETERANFLHKLITDKECETDYLEFKGCLKDAELLPSDELRRHYGKALSAFANAGGGVLIWGIQTDSTTGADCARSPALAPNATELRSHLDKADRDVTEPPVLGVKKNRSHHERG